MKILLVKLSSLGDVIHNIPIIWDIRKYYPDAEITWAIDESYIELIQPLLSNKNFIGLDSILPIPFRRLHKALKKRQMRYFVSEFKAMRSYLKQHSYDLIIDTQGLIKSALVCRFISLNPDTKIFGMANGLEYSGYEPLAKKFYTHSIPVHKKSHAIDCSRNMTANAFNLPRPNREESLPQFYSLAYLNFLQHLPNPLNLIKNNYVICFHATSNATKRWPINHWRQIIQTLSKKGISIVLPWGNMHERKISEEIASEIPHTIVPRAFTLSEAFIIISQAKFIIGLDTGLTHLSAALLKPTIEIYVDTPKWKYEGYWHSNIFNVGDKGQPPTYEEIKGVVELFFNLPTSCVVD